MHVVAMVCFASDEWYSIQTIVECQSHLARDESDVILAVFKTSRTNIRLHRRQRSLGARSS